MHSFFLSITLAGLVPSLLAVPTDPHRHLARDLDNQVHQDSPAHQKRVFDKRDSRTSAPSGCLSVGSDADYTSISDALESLGTDSTDEQCIFLDSGTYEEQISITYNGPLILYGETSDTSNYESNTVLITHAISSSDAGSLDQSSTVEVKASNFSMYNINVTNGYGYGAQAVALTANADRLGFYGCSFSGYQDTLYAKAGTQYYSGCLIEGAVDYIFGDASAWFSDCTIMSNGGGAITASSRETTDETTWYVFDTVNVVSNGTDLESKVYLGRPWRAQARVMYQYSDLSNVINPAGWTTLADDATPHYYEFKNTGDGADTSDREYETTATGSIRIRTVLGDDYASWVDLDGTESSISSTASSSRKVSETTSSTAADSACTPSAGGSSDTDDTPAIYAAIQSCGDGGSIVIPADTTYYLNTALNFSGCVACSFQLEGTLKVSDDLDYWGGQTAVISLKDVSGLTFSGSGTIDGNGQTAWDEFASDSSLKRATVFYIVGGSDMVIDGFTMLNAPSTFHSIKGGATNVLYSNLNLSAISTSDNEPKNTDGFDIGESTFVTLTNINVLNDDDCVGFKPSSNYTTVTNITCTGSHGLSIGSLGKENADTVSNIYVSGATMISSAKAVGIKTYPSGSSHGLSTVTNVTYTDIVVQDCDYAIQIQSCYGEDSDYCDETPGDAILTDIVFENFSGTTSATYAPATSNLDCGAEGTCDVTISGYEVESSEGGEEVLCANTPSDLGVTCTDGASG